MVVAPHEWTSISLTRLLEPIANRRLTPTPLPPDVSVTTVVVDATLSSMSSPCVVVDRTPPWTAPCVGSGASPAVHCPKLPSVDSTNVSHSSVLLPCANGGAVAGGRSLTGERAAKSSSLVRSETTDLDGEESPPLPLLPSSCPPLPPTSPPPLPLSPTSPPLPPTSSPPAPFTSSAKARVLLCFSPSCSEPNS